MKELEVGLEPDRTGPENRIINFRESFGLSRVESMACGTPVIALPSGFVLEIVVDGRTGLHVSTIRDTATALTRVPGKKSRPRCDTKN